MCLIPAQRYRVNDCSFADCDSYMIDLVDNLALNLRPTTFQQSTQEVSKINKKGRPTIRTSSLLIQTTSCPWEICASGNFVSYYCAALSCTCMFLMTWEPHHYFLVNLALNLRSTSSKNPRKRRLKSIQNGITQLQFEKLPQQAAKQHSKTKNTTEKHTTVER